MQVVRASQTRAFQMYTYSLNRNQKRRVKKSKNFLCAIFFTDVSRMHRSIRLDQINRHVEKDGTLKSTHWKNQMHAMIAVKVSTK